MTFFRFALRGLRYYWRTNAALALGFAAVVGTLGGALLVGDSVRSSLARIVERRIGTTRTAVIGAVPFGERGAVPILSVMGSASAQDSGRRANGVLVHGVDQRFWHFQRTAPAPADEASVSTALAAELGVQQGDTILVRVEKPSAIPKESLHGRRDDAGKTIRVRIGFVRPAEQMGEFTLRLQQGPVLAVFLPLARLQRELDLPGKANTVLLDSPADNLKAQFTLNDLGVRVRALPGRDLVSVETESAIISDALMNAVRRTRPEAHPVFSYLANSIRTAGRTMPYSLVTAVDAARMDIPRKGIVLNEWAARDLEAKPHDTVTIEYYVWTKRGSLETRTAEFQVHAIVPISGLAADRDLAPEYPGITEAKSLHDWDPPFPMNLGLIRPKDEDYWNQYRTTPKAFINYEDGRALWTSRFGNATSVRIPGSDPEAVAAAVRSAIDPADLGLSIIDARAMADQASRGSTDFGEYFTYFSFFVLVSALLLAGLLFRLSIEQRVRDAGMLRAVGWPSSRINRVLLTEGALVAVAGCILGVLAAAGYCALVLYGLRTWWIGAVGTTELRLSISPLSLAAGAGGGFAMAMLVMWWALRTLSRRSPRSLLAGILTPEARRGFGKWWKLAGVAAPAGALLLLAAGALKYIPAAGGFFGGAALLLIAALVWIAAAIGSPRHAALALDQDPALWKLGARSAAFRPGRAVAGIALIASATFLIVGLDAFRQDAPASSERRSGTGGFALVAESELPVFDLRGEFRDLRLAAFRLRPGDDASCLNLYQPRNPRVLGAPASFVREGRFAFGATLPESDRERSNPWLLLERELPDGVIPAIADANSITYVLHRNLGDEFVLDPDSDRPIRLKLVAALSGSTLQSELIISEQNFLRAFSQEQGYRFFLIDAPDGQARELEASLEDSLSDFGFDATGAAERLASYRRVENTYLSTFQALGALGLLLGTVGLAAVLLRNVLERRRELALLRALGYTPGEIGWVVVAENLFISVAGLAAGAACAVIAVMPTVLARGGRPPVAALVILLVAVPVTALLASVLAVRAAVRAPLLSSLRAE